ncbi:ABC transporter permease [Mumia sp. zg.B17]|uniref:ABC transporter permease n=1 Tax=unclassified Mumia TaxID=2621872 RepID=UPI001C6F259D|nr:MULTISPECIES: ABC transporter permease [unclassified Mumia]MBW9206988.1 ABC transporter permease [Mumia sp. zg.B17]MBW9210680.1 ABC transporter permease [Mumia sp. zg.B21]MDD9348959.1 ABC transporter permease [Mumia sp.]
MTTTIQTHVQVASPLPERSRSAKWLHDTAAVFVREILVTLRDPFTLIFSLLQPLVFLGLFGPLLDGMLGDAAIDGESALQWFLPGVLVMIAVFGTGMVGGNLLYELMTGAYERILATPLDRSSILVGRALKEFAPLVVQALLITVVAIPFGLAFYPAHVLLGLLILGIFGIGLGSLSYALGLASKNREWVFWGVQQSLIFPLLLLAGMMLPLEAGPEWMRVVSKFNPLTYIVDAERALFAGTMWDSTVAWGLLAALATCAVGLWVGIWKVKRTI